MSSHPWKCERATKSVQAKSTRAKQHATGLCILISVKDALLWPASMEVFAVTIFVSLLFAVLFAVLFIAERSQKNRKTIEQVALLPLDDGAPVQNPRH